MIVVRKTDPIIVKSIDGVKESRSEVGTYDEVRVWLRHIFDGLLKFKTAENIDIAETYDIVLPLTETMSISCRYCPIRIERADDGYYYHSGRFEFNDNHDRMTLIQFCTKRSIEINNK